LSIVQSPIANRHCRESAICSRKSAMLRLPRPPPRRAPPSTRR
jgi:hypothetical protein